MRGTIKNNKGKIEKNKKVKEGKCIFPFKYKYKIYNECIETEKGDICATEINPKTQTLIKYGYCEKPIKLSKKRKLKLIKNKIKLNQIEKKVTIKNKKLKIIDRNQISMSSPSNVRLNEEFVKILSELNDIMIRQGEHFRAKAYREAAEAIMLYPTDIKDPKQLEGVKKIGKTIMTKLNEYVETGTLKILERERKNPLNELTKVYGIGPKKAKELIEKGITSIDELKKNEDLLNENMKIGLKYFDDIEQRIPREEIDEYKKELNDIFNKIAPKGSHFEIVGSYRRGMKTSGDIDIIITNDNNDKKALDDFLDNLIKEKIILEVLSRGKTKSLTIARLPKMKIARRIDFLYTSPDEYAFAILYFTGSKIFNTVQRQRALNLGYSLNEHGLYKLEDGEKKDKIKDINFPDEKSIFKFLKMEYVEPEKRIDGSVVVPITIKSSSLKPTIKRKTLKKKLVIKPNHLELFRKEGISILKSMTETELSDLIRKANNAYYCNQSPIMTDNEYDILIEYISKKYPNNEVIKEGHTKCNVEVEKNKVRLPYEMWSMDKIKPDTSALEKWKDKYKGPYVLSCKLDGVSGLYSTEGEEPKLYTRGNGKIGQDISYFIPYLKLPKTKDVVIRGEFIISKKKFIENYSKEFSNSRNFVAGLINQKRILPNRLKDIDFVAYEVIKPIMNPSSQLEFLLNENIEVVKFVKENIITNEILSRLLIEWRDNYKYEIDGVICINDKIYPRSVGNPEHAFAFKMVISDQIAETKVLDVIWTPSKDGYLKPRVQVEPVILGGAKIEYATGFNGKFIKDNKIGVGAVIQLIRSGDVIPHILSVIEPAIEAQMPIVPYVWNETNVDIILKDKKEDITVREKTITSFFKVIGVEGLSTGNIKRIINAGFNTVPKILDMSKEDFLKVEGFKEKMAKKIYEGIKEKIKIATLPELMNASNIFGRGFGTKRFKSILDKYPDILVLKESKEIKKEKLMNVSGMAKKSVEKFMEHLPEFLEWAKNANIEGRLIYSEPEISIEKKENNKGHPLYGKKWLMTGFRDKVLIEKLKEVGAIQADNINKNIDIVIVKNLDEDTLKANQARKLNIPLMTPEQIEILINENK